MANIRPLYIVLFLFFRGIAFAQIPDSFTIIPRPNQLTIQSGSFRISATTLIQFQIPAADSLQQPLRAIAELLTQGFGSAGLPTLTIQPVSTLTEQSTNQIQLALLPDNGLGAEGYRLTVTRQRIRLEASQPRGLFYGLQSLLQMIPAPAGTPPPWVEIPACQIQDRPRYAYRGLHLDVSRHFFPVSFIKKYIDQMARYKFNQFHWHLTDDQGWRIEIKKYPKLTQVGSERRQTIVGHYEEFDPPVFDGKPYGGFYTQAEIREVVQYAQARYVNIVPEIELPGHALALLAAYPELGCPNTDGKPRTYEVATKWGVFGDVLCPSEKTFSFVEDVLTEVMALFPGPYIHLGGDECPKQTWRNSPFCQRLMKREGLRNAHELQRYIIRRIDRFIVSKGRRTLGWDEILQGSKPGLPLSAGATVMNWRGSSNAVQAVRQGHGVVMTPDKFCYLNYFQGDLDQEPLAFGGSLPLEKVYGFEPTPAGLTADQQKRILGAQACVWTEYIETPEQVEYMVWPRAAAMAEVVWTDRSQKNYSDFLRRLPVHLARFRADSVQYALSAFDARMTVTPSSDGILSVSLTPPLTTVPIQYAVDGQFPAAASDRYNGQSVRIDHSTVFRSATFQPDSTGALKPLGRTVTRELLVSKATGKSYRLLYPPTSGRPDQNYRLTNGLTGSIGGYELSEVVSFRGTDFGIVIDLSQSQPIQTVSVGFVKYTARDMCLPKQVTIAVSDDGQTFQPVGTFQTPWNEQGKRAVARLPFALPAATTGRYVRIVAQTVGRVPARMRHPGAVAQLAVDEVTVD